MVSWMVGCSTMIGWKRRSRAASLSIFLRYSLMVVAPITCSSPRESAGLRMLAASTEEPAEPAPTSMWNSSMKTIAPLALSSSITRLRRSSNCPRYIVPATREPTSNWSTFFLSSSAGTSPSMMRCARPSTMAVLPTPGSPIRAGLFLVRRAKIWMTRSISFCRPMTGSSLPASARAVRSVASWSTRGELLSESFSLLRRRLELPTPSDSVLPRRSSRPSDCSWRCSPASFASRRTRLVWRRNCSGVIPKRIRISMPLNSGSLLKPSRICSVPTIGD